MDSPVKYVPIFPVIADEETSVIPEFDRITKSPATPRFTTAGELPGLREADFSIKVPEERTAGFSPEFITVSLLQPDINPTNSTTENSNTFFVFIILNFKM